MFSPKILRPTPDRQFVRDLQKIDPDLRVSWAFERYFMNRWVIERKLQPERYWSIYASLLESGEPRYVDQPIFDTDQPIYDGYGQVTGHKIIGYRKYDLAPDHEWVMFADHLGEDILSQLRRTYAWERNHPLSRLAFERQQEEEERAAKRRQLHAEVGFEGVQEGWRRMGKTLQGGQPEKVMEGTELYKIEELEPKISTSSQSEWSQVL